MIGKKPESKPAVNFDREKLLAYAKKVYRQKQLRNLRVSGQSVNLKVIRQRGEIFPPKLSSLLSPTLNTFWQEFWADVSFWFKQQQKSLEQRWWSVSALSQVVKQVLSKRIRLPSLPNLPNLPSLPSLCSLSKVRKIALPTMALSEAKKKQVIKLSRRKSQISFFWHPYREIIRLFPLQTSLVLLSACGIFSGFYLLYQTIFLDLPAPRELTTRQQLVTTRILDRDGRVLFRVYEDENRTIIPLSAISPNLIKATIAIEDKDFYFHRGVSISGIVRATLANSRGEPIQGGSTITQQLVKTRLLSSERTINRKLREALLAVLVEFKYSKNEILEMYFNQIAYGGSAYGAEEAAFRYFGKSAADLDLAEAALLAGLPAAPSAYSPFGPNPEASFNRQQEVLRRMVEDGYIDENQALAAASEKLNFRQDVIDIQAPHFVMYVKQLLADQYTEAVVSNGGLEVVTTLDLELQNQTQKIVADEIAGLRGLRINNGAALITNPQTGEILSMVGSQNYFDFAHDGQVNVTVRPRQPGSSIKPVTYSLALERGYTPSTLILDAPITYQAPGSPPYSPKNYDGRFHGNVTLREALASSYNIPAVKTLATLGVDNLIDHAEKLGISTWIDRSRFGLSLTLGGGEILMTDMARAYGTFATSGYSVPINPILKVTNYKGEVLYENTCALYGRGCSREQVLTATSAYQITSILSDNEARTPAFGPMSSLNIPGQEVAVKTGTTNSLRDNWTIGYTSDRLVATWVGNNDNSPMSYVASGVTGASPIWNKVMRLLLDDNSPHQFARPANLIDVRICASSNSLPCSGCPKIKSEIYRVGTQPIRACSPAFFKPKPTPSP